MSEPQALATEPRITTEVRDHVLLIGLNRPKKKNAFDLQMLEEYAAAFVELERTPELRVGLVFAHGSDFTAGLDLANVGPAVAAGKNLFPDGAIDPFRMHEPFGRKPVIGAAHGLCLTIGIEMLLSFDIRLAAEGTRFGQIEIKRGIFPFGGATFRWVSNCGWGNALRYLLTADELDAAEAYRIGLVQEVVAPDKLLARALELAHRVAAQAPLGMYGDAHQCTPLRRNRRARRGGRADAGRAPHHEHRRRPRRRRLVPRTPHGQFQRPLADLKTDADLRSGGSGPVRQGCCRP